MKSKKDLSKLSIEEVAEMLKEDCSLEVIYKLRELIPDVKDGKMKKEYQTLWGKKAKEFYTMYPGLAYISELAKIKKEAYEILAIDQMAQVDPTIDPGRIRVIASNLSRKFNDPFIDEAALQAVVETEEKARKNIGGTFGRYLKHERKSKGLTLLELSQLTGISTSYINRLERGDRKTPSIQTVQKLSEALNVPMSSFMNVVKENSSKKAVSLPELIYANQITLKEGGEPLSLEKKTIVIKLFEFIATIEWQDDKVKELSKLMEIMDELFGA